MISLHIPAQPMKIDLLWLDSHLAAEFGKLLNFNHTNRLIAQILAVPFVLLL